MVRCCLTEIKRRNTWYTEYSLKTKQKVEKVKEHSQYKHANMCY